MRPLNTSELTKRHRRQKGRKSSGSFLLIPHHILNSNEFGMLSPAAVKLLIELAKNYKGNNNGDLSAVYSCLKTRGWKSPGTLSKSIKELKQKGWIILTRQGGKNRCSLYAVSWWPIDECKGKIDYAAEVVASNLWKTQTVVASSSNLVAN